MQTRILGRTGLTVSRLSLGGLFVAGFAAEKQAAENAVHRALDLGVNLIDTAPGYHNSEEVLGGALANVRQSVLISTKVGGRPVPFDPRNPKGLFQSVEESLRLLGREVIDILMIHEPERQCQYDWWTDWHQVNGPVLEVAAELKKKGIIRFLGLGGTTVSQMAHLCGSGKFDVVLTAFNYSLLWREAGAEVFEAAKKNNMGIMVGSPLQQGALAKKYEMISSGKGATWMSQARLAQFQALYRLVDEVHIPLPELALRFVISNPDVHSVLMGARSANEVEQNAAAVERGPLPEKILGRLDDIAALVPFRPYGEPFGIGWHMEQPDLYPGLGAG